ncbi:hypothetical protein B0H13DRAFT_1852972 [Mycena leptocephala]|nr:hypothetical protein B0H13DRAFT_1852972 [Mycena leptocephala]
MICGYIPSADIATEQPEPDDYVRWELGGGRWEYWISTSMQAPRKSKGCIHLYTRTISRNFPSASSLPVFYANLDPASIPDEQGDLSTTSSTKALLCLKTLHLLKVPIPAGVHLY